MNFLIGHCDDPRYSVLTLEEFGCSVVTVLTWALILAFIIIIVIGIIYAVGYLNR